MRKSSVVIFLRGQKRANKLIAAERLKRLSCLPVKESVHEYDALCKMWEANPRKQRLKLLDQRHIQFAVNLRKRLNKAGAAHQGK